MTTLQNKVSRVGSHISSNMRKFDDIVMNCDNLRGNLFQLYLIPIQIANN